MKTLHPHERSNSVEITQIERVSEVERDNEIWFFFNINFLFLKPLSSNNESVEGQLKYENDRLKLALAQSSTNARKWEEELQILKNNNARLTTALQESHSNVEEWKKQLQFYKDECTRLRNVTVNNNNNNNDEHNNSNIEVCCFLIIWKINSFLNTVQFDI